MTRNIFAVDIIAADILKSRLSLAVVNYSHAVLLDSNNHFDQHTRFHWIAALGSVNTFSTKENSFEEFRRFRSANPDWLFGHLTYDLKNELEKLETRHPDQLGFTGLQFFVPDTIIYSKPGSVVVESFTYEDQHSLLAALPALSSALKASNPELSPRTSREEYLNNVNSLKEHLKRGNIYEVNYCIEFSAYAESFLPAPAFKRLNETSQAPFAAFYKSNDQYLLCSSPERYLQKSGSRIISQPIKGTARRSPDTVADSALKQDLYHSEKERSENVMITDLVRNDLSRTAADGSVKVEELFGIYSFKTVHQMITTISSLLDDKYDITDLLQTTFPMGSMTGAPKVRAMKLIEEHENFARNLFSGSVGYITSSGDFDFNVIIRSLFYNEKTRYLSARVGSAITIHCDAEKEYEECLLKAANLFNALKSGASEPKEP